MFLIPGFSKRYISLSLKLYKLFSPVGMYMIVPFHLHPQLELGLSLTGIVLDAVDGGGGQILRIGLSNFFGHQYQM